MRINHPTDTTKFHDLKPTFFSRLDLIVYSCFDSFKAEFQQLPSYWHLIPLDSERAWRVVKLFVVLPATCALTLTIMRVAGPIIIGIDLIEGVAECIQCKRDGYANPDILKIAYCKLVASPIQQVLHYGMLSHVNSIALQVLIRGTQYCSNSFEATQSLLNTLPDWLNPNNFSTFATTTIFKAIRKTIWNELVASEISTLREIENSKGYCFSDKPDYLKFRQKCLEGEPPESLLGINDASEIQSKYRRLTLLIHPDRNLNTQAEASVLFRILQLAKETLSLSFIELIRKKEGVAIPKPA